ncbi:MAG TPA: pyridoxamine 5'-phosphate oxidase family protein [Thermoanaerobaculia bacterium]|nr:pyridoxamine 5'-phosphate oxidase family protein [Thermoanaerobaculia bacterium]
MITTVTGSHEGELAVRARAGVEIRDRRGNTIPPGARAFLAARRFVVVATCGEEITASLLAGTITATEREVRIAPQGGHIERVTQDLALDPRIGLLAIDFEAQQRMRINGSARVDGGTIVVTPDEVYANCPQYIGVGDTFFIATAHPTAGADISHRGGPVGFVHEDGNDISWPDYSGNNMFNTLGNLAIDPRCGLLFVDFETGAMRQVHGRARVEWNGAERTVRVAAGNPSDTPPPDKTATPDDPALP